MDQPPQLNIPFGLFYNILTCFDRRELCQLRNVNHRHYTVIENKFGTTRPYLVFDWQYLEESSWRWPFGTLGRLTEDVSIQVRKQLPTSKFVRFGFSNVVISSAIDFVVLSISHVWENRALVIGCTPDFIWNDDLTQMAAKAKYLDLETKSLVPYLRQLTSGNCVHLEIFIDATLEDVQLPWKHILNFLFKLNTEGIEISASNPYNHHRGEMLEFLEQVKQKFLDSLVPVDFSFEWSWTMAPTASMTNSFSTTSLFRISAQNNAFDFTPLPTNSI
ncbi:hypothetical protein Ddc_12661 [Ditylenchus destructor]|nr:hypothetical protein Ddc_12661 [Ditylenchus destructor]